MDLLTWKEKNKKGRQYAHFDEKVSLEKIWEYISTPEKVMGHGFYPFIHYEKRFNKYNREKGIVLKTRDLCYSAHIDRYIYAYYSFLINQKYNEYLQRQDMDMVAVAYRDNLKKNNIHFAKIAFDCIREAENCYIIIGDFTHFFDCLSHGYLKKRLCDVLSVDKLPNDYYAVFKNITRFSTWELVDLLFLNGLTDTEKDIQTLNSYRRVLTTKQFKQNKAKYVKKNENDFGIPQGSAISAVLANVYMIKADEQIKELIKIFDGLYMRYSDDFIIVIPKRKVNNFTAIIAAVNEIIKSVPNLILQPEKTQIFEYNETKLINCNSMFLDGVKNGKNEIDYLGFNFNGKEITIKDKTISKYYYKMYRKVKTIIHNGGYTRSGKRISCKNLYEKYSVKGARLKDEEGNVKGNFLTYVQRAQRIFGADEPIDKKTKKHMAKIRKKLKAVF